MCFQPEFLREGTSISDYDNPPFTIVGTDDEYAIEELRSIFGHLPCEMIRTSVRTAETLKYACNAFHAVKVTFANEIGRVVPIGERRSARGDEAPVHGPAAQHLARLPAARIRVRRLVPAEGPQGAALHGEDERRRAANARASVMTSNRVHVDHAISQVLEAGKRSVGFVGLSFKAGTDDLRESPLVAMVECFIGKGLDVCIYDPAVNIARLVGANRRFIEESIPHISSLMTADLNKLVERSEVLVVAMKSPEVLSAIARARPDQIVLGSCATAGTPRRSGGLSRSVLVIGSSPGDGAASVASDLIASGKPRSRNRVLIIVENLPCPFDRRVWQEARTLHAAGYTVSIICPKGPGYERSYELLDGIEIYRHPQPFEASGALGYFAEYTWALLAEFLLSLKVALPRARLRCDSRLQSARHDLHHWRVLQNLW